MGIEPIFMDKTDTPRLHAKANTDPAPILPLYSLVNHHHIMSCISESL